MYSMSMLVQALYLLWTLHSIQIPLPLFSRGRPWSTGNRDVLQVGSQ
jgi:hypothetical protein